MNQLRYLNTHHVSIRHIMWLCDYMLLQQLGSFKHTAPNDHVCVGIDIGTICCIIQHIRKFLFAMHQVQLWWISKHTLLVKSIARRATCFAYYLRSSSILSLRSLALPCSVCALAWSGLCGAGACFGPVPQTSEDLLQQGSLKGVQAGRGVGTGRARNRWSQARQGALLFHTHE